MKTIDEFLADLRHLEVKLWADGDDLCYRANKETLTPTLRQELKERKTEILAFLNQVDTATSSNLPPILLAPREKDLPLSFAQQRLWFLNKLQSNSSAYNMPASYRLTGNLSINALEQSLNEIVRRQEILRTTFTSTEVEAKQVISSNIDLTLPIIIDLQELPPDEKQIKAQQIATQEAQQPFDLTTGPLFSAQLLRLSDQEHLLLLNFHHIIFDGWSFNIFFQELTELYTAFANGQPSPLPELPIQYADFAHWQREWLQGKVLESQLSYWKQQLGGSLPILQLPIDYLRPPIQTYPGAYQALELSPDLTKALKTLSQREGVTLFMTLLAAFETLLSRYSGQEDIIVGTPITGRNQVETEELIGLFVNSLAIRTNLSGNPIFRQLLSQVREVTLGAYEHQDLPLEKLIEELNPERDLRRSPLFQVMFAFQNTPSQPWELPRLTITPLEIHSGTSKFDLTLALKETSEGIKGGIEYNTDLFKAETITRMSGHLLVLLEGIIANPEQRLSGLPILTPAEQHQLLVEWNDTASVYPKDKCIHQLFEEQVERTPDAIAVVFDDQQLTYQELNRRANQLAHYLQNLGVKPEVLVGICLERSLEMIVGILGILKAGGVYVPLDPDYPAERLAFMLKDTQVPVLLTQQSLVEQLPSTTTHVICFDTDWETISIQSTDNPRPTTTINNLAYVIYTSGSTGKPKGVAVPHKAVTRLLFNTNYIKLEPDDKIAQVSNNSFDAATFEIWGALLHGAKLVVIPKEILLSPQEFAAQLLEQEISVLFLTTALFNQLASIVPQAFKHLRYLLFGGEAVDTKQVRNILKKEPPQRFIHVYGPTESTTFSSWYLIQNVPEKAKTLPIGRPISNTQIYILDRHLNPVPIGVSGELYIGGDGLARGYLNRPKLTEEKFIPNPLKNSEGAHLYKTGDLARYLPDGNIEFLGRLDNQVKIRGFRIELGEIESTLTQHPDIRNNIVLAQEDTSGNKFLIAYITINQEDANTVATIRSFLQQKLPDYMIPSKFILLESFPLTSNGKIDRLALAKQDWSHSQAQNQPEKIDSFVTPRNDLELMLAKIWQEVLGIQNIEIKDNFFELGGHSLLAVTLFAKIEKLFGINLPLAILFQAPTIEKLAKTIHSQRWSALWSSLVPIQPYGSKLPFFCVHAVGGSILSYQKLAIYLGQEQPFYGLQAQGLDGKREPNTRVEDMAAYYIEQIKTIQPEGPYFLGGHSFGGIVAFEMARQLQRQGQQIALLASLDRSGPNYVPDTTFSDWFSIHLKNLAELKLKEKLVYVESRIIFHIKQRIPQPLSQVYARLSYVFSSAQEKRNRRVFEANLLANKNYVPKIYPGKVTLFRAKVRPPQGYHDPNAGWGGLALGGIEIHEIPGDHTDLLLKDSALQILAKKLGACLDKASGSSTKKYLESQQAESSDTKPSQSKANLSSPISLVTIQPNGNKPPLFGIHVLGKGCKSYYCLARHLGSDQPIYGLNYGLAVQTNESKPSPLLQVEKLATHYIKEIQALQPQGPYFLAGHSFGGQIAFEMAQQLFRQGQKVALLCLFDTRSPTAITRIPWKMRVIHHWDKILNQGFYYFWKKFTGKIIWIKNRLNKRLHNTIAKLILSSRHSVSANKVNKFEQTANIIAHSTYIPKMYYGKITLFRAKMQPCKPDGWYVDPALGWGDFAGGDLELHEVPGDHKSMFVEPNIEELAQRLKICIESALVHEEAKSD